MSVQTKPTQTVLITRIYSNDVLQMMVQEKGLCWPEQVLKHFLLLAPGLTQTEDDIKIMLDSLVAGGCVAKIRNSYQCQVPLAIQLDRRFNERDFAFFKESLSHNPDWKLGDTAPADAVITVLARCSLSPEDPYKFNDEELFVLMWHLGYHITWKGLVNTIQALNQKGVIVEDDESGRFHIMPLKTPPKRKDTTAMTISTIKPISVAQGPQVKIDSAVLRQVATKYLDGENFDAARITSECQGLLATVMMNSVYLGKRLCAMKEVLGYGNFMTWLANDSGLPIDQRMANHYIALGVAVTERPELARLANMGISKASLFLSLPDAQLEEMATLGTLEGQPLDELETKTRKELIAHMRTLKKHVTEAKGEKEKAVEEIYMLRELLTEAQAKVGEQSLKKPSEIEQGLLSDMDAFQRLVAAKLNYYKVVDTTKLSDDTQLRLKALGEYVSNAADCMVLVLREKMSSSPTLSRHGAVTGMDWNELEERQKQTATYWND